MLLKTIKSKTIVSLAIISGVLYNFWLFGFIFDPKAITDNYFSDLEAYSKPYSWFFILGDVLTSLIVLKVAFLIWQKKVNKKIMIAYGLFGIATLLDAVVPIADKCSDSITSCGINPSQVLSFHDLASLVAYLSIFYCLLSCYKLSKRSAKPIRLRTTLNYTFYLWIMAGIFLLISIITNVLTTLSQGLFLGMMGVGVAVVPAFLLFDTPSK